MQMRGLRFLRRSFFVPLDHRSKMSYNKSMIIANATHAAKQFLLHRAAPVAAFVMLVALVWGTCGVVNVSAVCDMNNMSVSTGADCARGNGQPAQLVGDGGIFNRITSILLFVVGAIAVIMLIFGGIRYIVSGGDQANVTAAKNTILYAIIGIIVALLAYAAVKFVTTSLLSGLT